MNDLYFSNELLLTLLFGASIGYILNKLPILKSLKTSKKYLLSFIGVSILQAVIFFKMPIAFIWFKEESVNEVSDRGPSFSQASINNFSLLLFYGVIYLGVLFYILIKIFKREQK